MKFKRIPSKVLMVDYPDFEPGDIVKMRGYGPQPEELVIEQYIKPTKSGKPRKEPKNHRIIITLSYSFAHQRSYVRKYYTCNVKDYYKGNDDD